jgi:hypothetical protein
VQLLHWFFWFNFLGLNGHNIMNKNSKRDQKELNKGRRKSLLGVGTAVGAAVWHKPIMNNVVLPVHAQTTITNTNPSMLFTLTTTQDQIASSDFNIVNYFSSLSNGGAQRDESTLTRVVDFIVPKVQAGLEVDQESDAVFASSSSENFLAFYLAPDGEDTYTLQLYGEGVLEGRKPPSDCIISALFQISGAQIGVAAESLGLNCLGESGAGPSLTINSIAEDGSTASIDLEGQTIELMADPAASPFTVVPCKCVFEENTVTNVATTLTGT